MCRCHGSIDEHAENVLTYKSNSSQYASNANQSYTGNAQYHN